MLTLVENGRVFSNFSIKALRAENIPDAKIATALRKKTQEVILQAVDGYRQRLAGVEAGTARPGPERIGIWAAKARVAREYLDGPDAMAEPFKTHLAREAAAKGRTLAEQLQRIVFKADTFEALGMMIDAMEAEAVHGLSQISDEDGLAGGFDTFLAQAAQAADAAFADAQAALAA